MLTLQCGDFRLRLASPADDDLLVRLLPDDFDHAPDMPDLAGLGAGVGSGYGGFASAPSRCAQVIEAR